MQSWVHQKSFQVPAFILAEGNQCLPTTNVRDGLPLSSVSYIYSDVECLLLRYSSQYSKNKGGLLMLENYDLKARYGKDLLQHNFHPFPSFISNLGGYIDISVSDDQQFISISKIDGDVSRY